MSQLRQLGGCRGQAGISYTLCAGLPLAGALNLLLQARNGWQSTARHPDSHEQGEPSVFMQVTVRKGEGVRQVAPPLPPLGRDGRASPPGRPVLTMAHSSSRLGPRSTGEQLHAWLPQAGPPRQGELGLCVYKARSRGVEGKGMVSGCRCWTARQDGGGGSTSPI